MIGRLDVRRAHQRDLARIDDDQLRALAQPALELRGEHRMALGRIGADDHDHVRLHHGRELLRAGRFAQRVLETVTGRRMTDARAGIDVVVVQSGAHQLLHQERFLVRAARRGDAADRVPAVFRLEALELRSGVRDRLVPAHLAPRIGDARADHRLGNAVGMRRIAVRKPPLHAGVALIRVTVAVRHHAHDLLGDHLRLERATDAAVGAGGRDCLFGLTQLRPAIFSLSAPVGHASTHAPQDTHSDSRKLSCWLADTRRIEAAALQSSARTCPGFRRRRARSASTRCTGPDRKRSTDCCCLWVHPVA